MREYRFSPKLPWPVVNAVIVGPRSPKRIRLVFDTGATRTQIHYSVLREIGLPKQANSRATSTTGAGGEKHSGYLATSEKFCVLGAKFDSCEVAGYDFSHLLLGKNRFDGLLGWDLIREFHLEMDGPSGILRVY